MTIRKPSRRQLRSLCAEVHSDDGENPREWLRKGRPARKVHRKSRQLCSQVAEALDAILAGDCGDDVLQNLQVVTVEPAPDTARLLVTVRVHPHPALASPVQVLERLARASGRLRYGVAGAITRKRAPILVFRVAIAT